MRKTYLLVQALLTEFLSILLPLMLVISAGVLATALVVKLTEIILTILAGLML